MTFQMTDKERVQAALDGIAEACRMFAAAVADVHAQLQAFAELAAPVTPKQAPRFKVEYQHPDCKYCEEAVEMCIEQLTETGGQMVTWCVMEPVMTGMTTFVERAHNGTATRD